MEQRSNIPVLAILGLSFTGCPGGGEPNPIVGEWGAVQLDGEKLPDVDEMGPYSAISGLRLTVEDDLSGSLAHYYENDHGDYEIHYSLGTDLVVDDSEAPKYRVELVHDLFRGGDGDYYDSVGYAVPSAGHDDSDDLDDGDDAPPLAAAPRPVLALAEMVLTCTLEQDVLTCVAGEGDEPHSLVFKRKQPVEDD